MKAKDLKRHLDRQFALIFLAIITLCYTVANGLLLESSLLILLSAFLALRAVSTKRKIIKADNLDVAVGLRDFEKATWFSSAAVGVVLLTAVFALAPFNAQMTFIGCALISPISASLSYNPKSRWLFFANVAAIFNLFICLTLSIKVNDYSLSEKLGTVVGVLSLTAFWEGRYRTPSTAAIHLACAISLSLVVLVSKYAEFRIIYVVILIASLLAFVRVKTMVLTFSD